jgi:hypothetical protein
MASKQRSTGSQDTPRFPANEESDCQSNRAREAWRDTEIERPYTSASNNARWISKGWSATRARGKADKWSKNFGSRLKGKAGVMRSIPLTIAKSPATRFYRLMSGHASTRVNLKWFGHWEDNTIWWCGGVGWTVAQPREHLIRQCS